MDQLSISTLVNAVGGLAALQFLVSLWLSERFKAQLQQKNASILEALRWELRAREQAAKVAEYMASARVLHVNDPPERYQRMNQLSWELALWLPADLYRKLATAMTRPDDKTNELAVLVEVRAHLLGTGSGNLSSDDIIFHAPGAGKHRALVTK